MKLGIFISRASFLRLEFGSGVTCRLINSCSPSWETRRNS